MPRNKTDYYSGKRMWLAPSNANLTAPRIAQLRDWVDGIEEGDVCAGSRGFAGN